MIRIALMICRTSREYEQGHTRGTPFEEYGPQKTRRFREQCQTLEAQMISPCLFHLEKCKEEKNAL
jgi:hypothetical protein